MDTILSPSDSHFLLTVAMPRFGLKRLNIDYSNSRKTWPDLWIDLNGKVPVITVTQEFLRQPEAERKKRLLHEIFHVRGLEHNDRIGYSTYPAQDHFSKRIYRQMVSNPSKEPWMMTREERLAEVDRLERENRSILATALMSEGNISPMQVGMFSRRQKAKWQADASAKMRLEAQIRYLRKSDEEIQRDITFKANKEREARISQLKRQISDIEGFGPMTHLPNGKLKVGYQRTVDIAKQELQALSEGKPVPEAVLKSHNPFLETMLTGAALAIGFKTIGYAEKALLKRRKRKGK